MDDAYQDPLRHDPQEASPGELLRSFRWTQRLAKQLVHDPALAADVQQEVWARALERFGDALPGRAWLAGTLRSMAFRARRSARRRRLHEARGSRSESVGSASEVILRSEAQQRVAGAVGRLPEPLRVALLLHFQESMSLAAVAEELGCSKSTAGERVQRGLALLRQELRDDDASRRACCLIALPFGVGAPTLTSSLVAASPSVPTPGVAAGAATSSALISLTVKKVVLLTATLAIAGIAAWSLADTRAERTDVDRGVAQSEAAPALQPPAERPAAVSQGGQERVTERSPIRVAPAHSVSDGSFQFRALVVDSNGKPVSRPRMLAKGRDFLHEALGSEDGSVELSLSPEDLEELELRNVDITVAGGPYQTLWSTYVLGNGTGTIAPPAPGRVEDFGTVTLHPAGALEGRARDEFDRPIAGAMIQICDVDPGQPGRRIGYDGTTPEVVTDREGRFLVPHIGREQIALYVQHPDFLVDSPLLTCGVTLGATTGPVYLVGRSADIVTGRVVDDEGDPIVGAYVNGTGNWSIRDTDETDDSGRFRIGLREGSPAAVEVYHPGWEQVGPTKDRLHGAGEIEIQMARVLPKAKFSVLAIDAATKEPALFAGVAVLAGSLGPTEGTGATEGPSAPKLVTQPSDGLPADFVPGQDRLVVAAKGYQTRVVSTEALVVDGTRWTVELQPALGVRGRVLQHGRPVAGARVQLAPHWLHAAQPREVWRAGGIDRLESVGFDAKALTGEGGFSPEYTLGLDGEPPPYRFVTNAAKHGQRTDEEGRFHFHGVTRRHLSLRVEVDGAPARVVGSYEIENGALDLGTIELGASASLSGRIESTWPWRPDGHVVVLQEPKQEVSLDADGGFRIDGLPPGSVYFSVDRRGEDGELAFENVPVFHLTLAAGESRSVTVSLDPFAPSALDLDLTIGGRAPSKSCRLELAPVDRPSRVFPLWCEVDGRRVTASTNALGPCTLSLTQRSPEGGRVRIQYQGPALELRAGETVERRVEIEAGWVRVALPPLHRAGERDQVDLVLVGADGQFEVLGIEPRGAGAGDPTGGRTVGAGPIPPGTYRASLRPGRWRHPNETTDWLAEFDVTVVANETTEVTLD